MRKLTTLAMVEPDLEPDETFDTLRVFPSIKET